MDFRVWFVVPLTGGTCFLIKAPSKAEALAQFLIKRPESNVLPVLTWQEYADEQCLPRPATELQYQIGLRADHSIPMGMITLITR